MRDWKTSEGLAGRGVPVAWNLAGGCQKRLVIDLHLTTLRLCIEASASVTPPRLRSSSERQRPSPSRVRSRHTRLSSVWYGNGRR